MANVGGAPQPNPVKSPFGRAPDCARPWSAPTYVILAAVFLFALVVRVLHWWGQMQHNPFFTAPTMDEEMHHQWAQQIAAGAGFSNGPFFRAPLYYYLLGGLYVLLGPNIVVARLLGGVLGALSCALLARLGFAVAGVRAGLIAGLSAAVYWPFVHFDGLLLTVGLEIFLNTLLLVLLYEAVRRWSGPLFLAAGVTWGLSALTRPNVLALAPGIALWLWMIAARPGLSRACSPGDTKAPGANELSIGRRRVARAVLLVFFGAAVTILPVTIRNYVVSGEWVLIASYGGVNFYIGNNPQADGVAAIVPGTRADWQGGFEDTHRIPEQEVGRKLTEGEVSAYWTAKAWDWIRAEPMAWLRLLVLKLRLFWSPVEIPNNQPDWFFARMSGISVIYLITFPIVACLGLAGLTLLGAEWRRWSLLLIFAGTYMLTVIAFFCPGRYRLPVVPVLMLLAAFALVRAIQLAAARRFARLGVLGAAAGVAALFLSSNPPARDKHWNQIAGMGHQNLGVFYARAATTQPALREQAVGHLREALRLRPTDALLATSLGMYLLKFGQVDEAGEPLRRALELNPDEPEAHYYYAEYLTAAGSRAAALGHYERAAALRPTWPPPQWALGVALLRQQRPDDALAAFEMWRGCQPDGLAARNEIGRVLAEHGYFERAAAQFEAVLDQQPGDTLALFNLATALVRLERYDAAAERYRVVVAQQPADRGALLGLAHALRRAGRTGEAVATLRDALRRFPDDDRLLSATAWVLATAAEAEIRNGTEAVRLAELAVQRAGRGNLSALDSLAAAYAEAGQYDQAAATAREGLQKAQAAGQRERAAQFEARLRLYETGRPYREAP